MSARRSVILAATDGTHRSRAVLERAAQLARILQTGVALVHVRKRPDQRFRLTPHPVTKDDLKAQMSAHGADPRDLHVLEGAAAAQIIDLANELDAGLVVLGPHRERRVLDALRLTTMERITLGVRCPVLIAQRLPALPYQRILGAITFSPACARGLALAAKLAPQAQLQAIHAVQEPFTARLGKPGAAMAEAEAARAAFMARDDLPQPLVLPEIVPGGVHEVLRYRMTEWKPDLLVIGSQSGRDPSRLGNYARDLMRAPPTDVLVTKPGPSFAQSAAAAPESSAQS